MSESAGTVTDKFGFLPINRGVIFDGGQIRPVPDLAEIIERAEKATHEDGFVDPPITVKRTAPFFDEKWRKIPEEEVEWKEVPGSQRAGFLHRFPASHEIEIRSSRSKDDLRKSDLALLIHFIGYIFGYRMQFHDWWHDGRVSMRGRHWVEVPQHLESDLLSCAYTTWKGWPEPEQTRFTNLLYMNGRVETHRWDWEQFTVNYMVFDACYKMVEEIEKWSPDKHKKRFHRLFGHFGIPMEESQIGEIIRLRNELFHESLWDGGQPGAHSERAFPQVNNLKRINERLICGIAGYRTRFLSTEWWHIGQVAF